MALFRAYFDDSGTHKESAFVVLGGLVGLDNQWESLCDKWAAKLAAPLPDKPRLSKFHLSACMAGKDDFRDYKPVEREALAGEFRDLIIEAGLGSTASAVDKASWDELVVGRVRDLLGPALQPCFLKCIDRAMEYAKAWGSAGDQIAVMFDKGIESDELRDIIDKYLWRQTEIVSVTFGRVEKFIPLQAADVIATESYWHAHGEAFRPPFQHYLRHARAEGLIFDRQLIIDELARRDANGVPKRLSGG
jgi:Protein of unknown function (DUF3800)